LKFIAISNNIVANRGALEVENGQYESDLGKTALPRRIPHKDICWGMGENSDRQFFLVLFWEIPVFLLQCCNADRVKIQTIGRCANRK